MFDEFFGLPLHVFIVHLTVVLLPMTALVAVAYAVLGSWRWLLRWPLLVLAAVSAAVTYVTVEAGEAFQRRLRLPDQVIGTHAERAELLLIFVLVFAVLAVGAVFAMGGPSLLASGAGARDGAARPVQVGIGVLLTVAAVLVVVWVVLTGDAGARAVWGNI